jgi:hypothetical protein
MTTTPGEPVSDLDIESTGITSGPDDAPDANSTEADGTDADGTGA